MQLSFEFYVFFVLGRGIPIEHIVLDKERYIHDPNSFIRLNYVYDFGILTCCDIRYDAYRPSATYATPRMLLRHRCSP